MNEWNIWRLIKAGFWLGIGFIIPSLIVYGLGTVMMVGSMSQIFDTGMDEMEDSFEAGGMASAFQSQFDKSTQIEIVEFHESKIGDQLLILGSIKNKGKSSVNSINIEAELFDSEGKYIYECSEYISKTSGSCRD